MERQGALMDGACAPAVFPKAVLARALRRAALKRRCDTLGRALRAAGEDRLSSALGRFVR
jgi:hypothetical protein